ncbi:hypothetical protein T08_3039 [Trichinella sp. T8]|nr:hypothetical protein T08_3039 [Trichinella sp. T8]
MVLWFNTLDCAGLAAYVIWTCKNPDWNARKSEVYRARTPRKRVFLKWGAICPNENYTKHTNGTATQKKRVIVAAILMWDTKICV